MGFERDSEIVNEKRGVKREEGKEVKRAFNLVEKSSQVGLNWIEIRISGSDLNTSFFL